MNTDITPEQIKVLETVKKVIDELKKVILGKDEIIIKILLSILAGGHILIEDIPGVGKTTLAVALSKALSLDYRRLQFTPDVLPSDVTGFNIYNKATGTFEYKKGPVFTNLFLADEINRTSSKTQSALLEIMEEGRITVDGVTHTVPEPFIVIATQNPIGSIGTQPLPESQLDRFMIRLEMGYPDIESEIAVLRSKQNLIPDDTIRTVADSQDIIDARKEVDNIFVSDRILRYIAQLADATRKDDNIRLGLSPRGTIALLRMTKATALLKGRNYVVPDDILYIFKDVVLHRLIISTKAKMEGITDMDILRKIISSVSVPNLQNN